MNACEQRGRAEAVRDGRVALAEAAAFSEHAQTCADCRAESARLVQIAETLRSLPLREPSALSVRIARRRLLDAASALAQQPERGRPRALAWAACLAAAALIALVFGALRHMPSKPATETARAPSVAAAEVASSAVEVRPGPDARWSRRSETTTERIALDEGTLWVKVTHGDGRGRLVFRVPDGEIADIGTTFTVAVEHGRTRRVAVEEGVVEVRVQGLAEITLRAGQSWERREDATVVVSHEALSNEEHRSEAEPSRARKRPAPRSESATASGAKSGAGRAEDAAYLRILSLERAGRVAEARAEARKYLSRFPTGFRREELQVFAGSAQGP